jgi:hypothetical protein
MARVGRRDFRQGCPQVGVELPRCQVAGKAESDPKLPPTIYSPLIPAALMIGHHFSTSAL